MRKLVHRVCQALERKTRPQDEPPQLVRVPQPQVQPVPADGHVDAMQSLMNVDAYRRHLAADSPGLHHALGGIEMNLARQLGREFNRSER